MADRSTSRFQDEVYRVVQQVPKGYVTTYALLASCLGCGSPRAVGQALKRNPFAPRVPCHRVIASDLSLGGFQGQTSGAALSRKARLLEKEGVRLTNGRLADPTRVHTFTSQACHGGPSDRDAGIMRKETRGKQRR